MSWSFTGVEGLMKYVSCLMLKSALTEPCLFFRIFLQSKMSLNSHFFARISEDMNCDQKCIEMTNVEDLIFATYFEYIPTSGS